VGLNGKENRSILAVAIINFPEINNIYKTHEYMPGMYSKINWGGGVISTAISRMQFVHSVNSQTLQQHFLYVERPPFPRLPPMASGSL
jgi:hypothetical protein